MGWVVPRQPISTGLCHAKRVHPTDPAPVLQVPPHSIITPCYIPSHTHIFASILLGRRQEQMRLAITYNTNTNANDSKTIVDRYDDGDNGKTSMAGPRTGTQESYIELNRHSHEFTFSGIQSA